MRVSIIIDCSVGNKLTKCMYIAFDYNAKPDKFYFETEVRTKKVRDCCYEYGI